MIFNKKKREQQKRVPTIKKYHKGEILSWWESLVEEYINSINKGEKTVPISETIEILPFNFQGSRFGHDSLRIEGSKEFIGRTLVMVSPLLEMENDKVRLELSLYELDTNEMVKPLNKENKHYVLYVRAIQRRPEHII